MADRRRAKVVMQRCTGAPAAIAKAPMRNDATLNAQMR
ncbi:hypothetical protein BSLA_01f0221 [Burkholderia stabilis]|nr:hypothetical protein BSLA_01f0221 [Burkholderia stabilis]